MNKKLFSIIMSIFIFGGQKAFSLANVSPKLEQSLKTHTNEPGFMSIIFALVVVILLIYLTGLIYSRLNIAGAKVVRSQLKNHELSKVVVLSTTPLGQSQNLHVVELNNKGYLIGSTQQSINLIKELGGINQVESAEEIEHQQENKTHSEPTQILPEKQRDTSVADIELTKKFNVHKKYL